MLRLPNLVTLFQVDKNLILNFLMIFSQKSRDFSQWWLTLGIKKGIFSDVPLARISSQLIQFARQHLYLCISACLIKPIISAEYNSDCLYDRLFCMQINQYSYFVQYSILLN